MKRRLLTTAAALLGLGLFGGCASTATNPCGEREGLFSRLFGNHRQSECPCIETGNIVNEGPVIPDPGCCSPGCGTPSVPVTTPVYPTMPPPTALPTPNPLAQPIPANPSALTKDAGK